MIQSELHIQSVRRGSPAVAGCRPAAAPIDFDLHGRIRIRLVDALPRDAAAVRRQLGPIEAPVAGEPDLTIRFVDRLAVAEPLRYLGVDDAGFTGDAFLVLRGQHKAVVRVQIPFAQLGQRCEIVCQRGLACVPLLIPMINLTALGQGLVPLHASAFTWQGTGALVTGWSKGGKTETLLAFLTQGAQYVGDEWLYLNSDGRQVYGIPEPVRVWDWHLQELPHYRARLSRRARLRLAALRQAVRWGQRALTLGLARSSLPRRILSLLQRQLNVQLPPETTFDGGRGPWVGSPDKLFFVVSHEAPQVTVQPADPQDIARRMVFSLQEEQAELMAYYHRFRFAFPEAGNELLERSAELQRQLLTRALAGKQAYTVYHPYPVRLAALFEAIRPLLQE